MIYQLLIKLGVFQMPPCRHVSKLSSQEMDRRLSVRESLALRAHLAICSLCREYRRQLRLLRWVIRRRYAAAQNAKTSEKLSDAARTRMKLALKQA